MISLPRSFQALQITLRFSFYARWQALLALVLLMSCALAGAQADAPLPQGSRDPIVFESRPDGVSSGGLSISVNPGAHTFRLLQRTQISEVGARLSSFQPGSVYAAIYQVATPDSVPDVAGDSRLIATTLIGVPVATWLRTTARRSR